jgi:hypothetical protein
MSITGLFGRLLGLERAERIEGYQFDLAASWARDAAAWLFFGCMALAIIGVLFYVRAQRQPSLGARVLLAALRASVLCLLLLFLAEPVLKVFVTENLKPSLWLVFDGSESMSIVDEMAEIDREKLDQAVGLSTAAAVPAVSPGVNRTRQEYVKALLTKDGGKLLKQLADDYRVRAYVFDNSDGVRTLELSEESGGTIDPNHLADRLGTEGQVTALGAALHDLGRRHATANLAGMVIFSDFDNNSGPSPLPAAKELGVQVFTVGVGAATAVDLSVDVQAPLHVKKDERGAVTVTVRQQGLDGQTVNVLLSAQQLGGEEGQSEEIRTIDDKPLTLAGPSQQVEFAYIPDKSGRFVLIAEVEPVPGETIKDNNRAQREITVLEDFLRLMYVEYEPTWEWRFIKEVFHRDKLVGLQGFRTFLRSSDPRVRQTNEMFLPTMSPPRQEFFANDVIFLGDLPASALSPRFCQMTDEFVRNFGGGLVVIAGPRFGPAQLADTPLANLLPVKLDASARINDRQPFRMMLSPRAEQYGFMQIAGDTPQQNQKAWDNMGQLPWYQPVERLHPLGVALAEHPTAKCADGRTPQPLIATRRAGRGEVVYIGFNETWRLRRMFGEEYYRTFWGQLIHRLGLSHELGSQKRFVVRTDRRRYQPQEEVLLTVEAYNAEFQALAEKDLPDNKLKAELIIPEKTVTAADNVQPISVMQLRDGVFETRFPVFAGGEHRIRVFDPVADKWVESTFQVASVSVERQSATRNVALQNQLAEVRPGGRSYDLLSASRLLEDIKLTPRTESNTYVITLWNTWLAFGLIVFLLLSEWLVRKWVNLP